MSEPEIIYNKNNITIKKCETNTYQLLFSLENQNIYLEKIINFTLLDVLYALNRDIFDDYKVTIHNECEATVYFLFKHFLRDLGLPQKYAYIKVVLEKTNNLIKFKAHTIDSFIPNNLPKDVELVSVNNINVECILETPHNMNYHSSLTLYTSMDMFEFLENFAIKVLVKIFLRIKQFIENYK
jgi:hypothetical protein